VVHSSCSHGATGQNQHKEEEGEQGEEGLGNEAEVEGTRKKESSLWKKKFRQERQRGEGEPK